MYSLEAQITVYTRTSVQGERSSYITDYYLTLKDNQLEIINPDCNTQHSVRLEYYDGAHTCVVYSRLPTFYGSKLDACCNKALALPNCSEIPDTGLTIQF